jgi:protein-tyrosine phosphatase
VLGPLFSALGVVFATAAVLGRGWELLFLWPALGFGIVGIAYLSGRPDLLGKRADGSLPLVAWVLILPYFAFAWLSWLILRIGGEAACNEVAPGVWVGRRPTGSDLPARIELVVDLTAEFPKSRSLRVARYLCLPTLDGTPPDAARLRELAHELAALEVAMYIHCAAGHARSATMAAAVLIVRGTARDVDDAERQMRAHRPGISINAGQRRMLKDSLTSTGS